MSIITTGDKSIQVILSLYDLTHILSAQKILLAHVNKDPSTPAAFIRKAYVVSIGRLEELVAGMEAAKIVLETKEGDTK